ncbi:twin-arginine translocase subunit TatC [Rhabdochromatium marinum]|uniref:twin-arginine translocase subunit TatC n=1 Tax=Rhabdochromatium marinum TaxID=48729 RepID=UPI001907E826|nr:twin-arginine translocase subunit TatC [Rhabdochromatium marinum]MBK1647053.1 twin-arginine translocase subunit TatC [Rhabdochromatium marinum]
MSAPQPSPPLGAEDGGIEQPFIDHLIELRDRLLRMIVAIAIAFLGLFPFANSLYTWVANPIRAQLPEGATMIATQVASPFLTPFKLALVAAVFIAMPYILYQLWAFIAPGLYRHEKRLALPLLASSIVLFYLGMTFAYFVVFPLVFGFFTSVTPEGVQQMPDIAFYLEFILKLFFAFGLAFEIPIATILLVAAGITTPANLANKRPYVIVGVFIAGMLLTPPDVISQTLLAIPMWLLYELGILFSRFFQKGAAQSQPTDDPPPPDQPKPSNPPQPPAPGSDPALIGQDIDTSDFNDPERFRPLTDEEMEAELDAIEAEELLEQSSDRASAAEPPAPAHSSAAAWLQQANLRRAEGNLTAARHLLYRVLEEGNADQRRVARNILSDLDT